MDASKKVILELTIREAKVLGNAIQHYSPPQNDEMISIMLYARIKQKIEEAPKNGSS